MVAGFYGVLVLPVFFLTFSHKSFMFLIFSSRDYLRMQFFSFRRIWSLLPAPYMASDVLTMLLAFMGFSSFLGDRPYSEGMMVERWLAEDMFLYYRPLIIRIDGYQQLGKK